MGVPPSSLDGKEKSHWNRWWLEVPPFMEPTPWISEKRKIQLRYWISFISIMAPAGDLPLPLQRLGVLGHQLSPLRCLAMDVLWDHHGLAIIDKTDVTQCRPLWRERAKKAVNQADAASEHWKSEVALSTPLPSTSGLAVAKNVILSKLEDGELCSKSLDFSW